MRLFLAWRTMMMMETSNANTYTVPLHEIQGIPFIHFRNTLMLLSFRLDGLMILTRNWSYSRINEVVLSRFIQVLYRL